MIARLLIALALVSGCGGGDPAMTTDAGDAAEVAGDARPPPPDTGPAPDAPGTGACVKEKTACAPDIVVKWVERCDAMDSDVCRDRTYGNYRQGTVFRCTNPDGTEAAPCSFRIGPSKETVVYCTTICGVCTYKRDPMTTCG